jgi:hypothetical protein
MLDSIAALRTPHRSGCGFLFGHLKGGTMNTEERLDRVCELESEQTEVVRHIRQKVLEEGKHLRALQKEQKKEQNAAKERGEQPQTWKEWVAEQKGRRASFPGVQQTKAYMRISQFPGAYEKGMSVKEAYKNATAWKKNGGSPPPESKVAVQTRLPNQIGNWVGKACNKLERQNEVEDWSTVASDEGWTDDDFTGMENVLLECRQEINHSLRKLRAIKETVSHD